MKQQRISRNKVNRQLYLPPLSAIFYFDLLIFILAFFVTLISNFTERSVQFNLVICSGFLLKAMAGAYNRQIKSFLKLRKLMVVRMLVNCFVLLPILGYYLYQSRAYKYNFAIIAICIVASELLLILKHCGHLFTKSTIECMEVLQASQRIDYISHFNSRSKSIVAYVNTLRASTQLVQSLGFRFDPSQVPRYPYFKPENKFMTRQFNKDRIEYIDDLQRKMQLHQLKSSPSAEDRQKYLQLLESQQASASFDIFGGQSITFNINKKKNKKQK